jgi:hypothetical protein
MSKRSIEIISLISLIVAVFTCIAAWLTVPQIPLFFGVTDNKSGITKVNGDDHFKAQSTPFEVEASEIVTVTRASTAILFNGDLIIAVISASENDNQATAVISSPGFQELTLDKKHAGYKISYESNANYEIQIMSMSSDWITSSVTFRVIREFTGIPIPTQTPLPTQNIPTPTSVLIEGSQIITVSRASAGNSFNEIFIAVIEASIYENKVIFTISSPGFPELKVEGEKVGYKTFYKTNSKYEIQVITVSIRIQILIMQPLLL